MKLSIKVVIYEMCGCGCFFVFLPFSCSAFFLSCFVIYQREKPGLIISRHILCALRMSAVGLSGSCFLVGFCLLYGSPATLPVLQAGDKGKGRVLAVGQVAPQRGPQPLAPVSRCMSLALSALDCLIARGQQNPSGGFQNFLVIEYSTHLPNPLSFFGLTTLEILPFLSFCQVCAHR